MSTSPQSATLLWKWLLTSNICILQTQTHVWSTSSGDLHSSKLRLYHYLVSWKKLCKCVMEMCKRLKHLYKQRTFLTHIRKILRTSWKTRHQMSKADLPNENPWGKGPNTGIRNKYSPAYWYMWSLEKSLDNTVIDSR